VLLNHSILSIEILQAKFAAPANKFVLRPQHKRLSGTYAGRFADLAETSILAKAKI